MGKKKKVKIFQNNFLDTTCSGFVCWLYLTIQPVIVEKNTKYFRLLRVKECDINTTMCLKCGKCLKVATIGHFVADNMNSKMWKIFQKHSKTGATICPFG